LVRAGHDLAFVDDLVEPSGRDRGIAVDTSVHQSP
jgi:hypothetical protein